MFSRRFDSFGTISRPIELDANGAVRGDGAFE